MDTTNINQDRIACAMDTTDATCYMDPPDINFRECSTE